MICVSCILSSLVIAVCEMSVSTVYLGCFRGPMQHVLKPFCHIGMCCWGTQYCQSSCSVVYSSIVLLLVFILVWIFLFELDDCCSCWLLWLNISFNMSGKSFFKVSNLSHSNCIGFTWIFYLLLICIALVFTQVISSSCAFLMLAGNCRVDATHTIA